MKDKSFLQKEDRRSREIEREKNLLSYPPAFASDLLLV